MKPVEWNFKKNEELIEKRGVAFEQVLLCIENGQVHDVLDHHNRKKYAHQRYFIVEINAYAYVVPFVEDSQKIYLKTIIPSRKYTKKYLERD